MQKKKSKGAAVRPTARKRRTVVAKRERRTADDLLNRIVQAAREEFKRSGFAGTTTAAIARKADVTEAQLFRYFESKSNLFRETIFEPLDQQLSSFVERHVPGQTRAADSKQMAHLYTTELQSFVSENAGMLTSLVVAQTYDTGTKHGVGEIKSLSTYFDRGASIMTARMKGKPKVDPKLMVRVSFAAVLACVIFKDWIFPRGLASDEAIRDAVNDFVLEGISANP